MNTPKISVIIPTYNRANLIKNTIMGVINQTFTDWELLIVDDGSTDNTKELVSEFIENDKRIHYFYQEASGGPSSPRNLGIEKAAGEYVAFLDSDDEWFPTKLEKQLDLFEKSENPKLGVVNCFAYTKDNKTKKILSNHNKSCRGNLLNELINNPGLICTSSCLMTKLSILREAGFFDINLKTYEDLDMWLRISKLGYEFDYVPEYLLNYLVHDNNIFYGKNNINMNNQFDIFIKKNYKLYLNYTPSFGNYFFSTKDYEGAKKFLIRNLFRKDYSLRQKIRIIGQLIITYYPPSEKIWQNIKKLFKK